MFKTTRGLVLREVRYKEADRILTVLTEDIGKMTVKARGALRKGSKIAAATQFLVFSELTMLERNGFWTVSEGSTIEEFKGLRGDITALSLASYFAEHEYMTRVAFQRLCGLTSSTASRRLHQLVEAGKLRDIGTRHQSLYVPAR